MIKKPKSNYFKDIFTPKFITGEYYEQRALSEILKFYKNKYELKNVCKTFQYDFQLTNDIKYEVKTDMKGCFTNNLAIEYLQFNIPSGIQTTEAEYYIIVLPYNDKNIKYILIQVLELKFLIATKQYKFIIQPTQNNEYTGNYIFNVELVIKNGLLINAE
jgi:hypothetical protein